VLLNGLKEDQNSLFQGVPPQLQPSQPQMPLAYNTASHLNINFNQQQQTKNFGYNQQNNSYNMSQSFPMPPNTQLISQIPPNTNPMEYFQMKMQNSSNQMPPLPLPSKQF